MSEPKKFQIMIDCEKENDIITGTINIDKHQLCSFSSTAEVFPSIIKEAVMFSYGVLYTASLMPGSLLHELHLKKKPISPHHGN